MFTRIRFISCILGLFTFYFSAWRSNYRQKTVEISLTHLFYFLCCCLLFSCQLQHTKGSKRQKRLKQWAQRITCGTCLIITPLFLLPFLALGLNSSPLAPLLTMCCVFFLWHACMCACVLRDIGGCLIILPACLPACLSLKDRGPLGGTHLQGPHFTEHSLPVNSPSPIPHTCCTNTSSHLIISTQ